VCNEALARHLGWRDRPKLKIEAFETFGFQKWTLSTECGISILVVKYHVTRRLGDISVQFVTTNGATIPALGYGTYGMARSDMLRMIPAALNAGFRHFDTAQIYRNEGEVGERVAASGLWRKEAVAAVDREA
jgi:hypothetical protein